MAATSQIEIETTLPCLDHLPLPGSYPQIFYRLFLPEDLQAYNTFFNQSLIQRGKGNPHFETSNTQDRFQRIIESSFTQGIHLGFFLKIKGEMVLVGEGGVYLPESNWPSIYWTHLDLEINELSHWKLLIPVRIQTFWSSIPRKTARLRVDVDSLLKDSQGRQSSIELLCFQGEPLPFETWPNIFEEYKESHWRIWSNIVVKTTIPSFESISNLTTNSNRLILRQLTLDDADALYSVQKQENAMRSLGWNHPQPNLESTREYLASLYTRRLSYPYFSILIGIFLKGDNKEQEMIGVLGIYLPPYGGYPTIHYVLKEEYWGKKYGTEFLQTFITYWSSLPRKQVYIQVDPSRLDFQLVDQATERVCASSRLTNLGSRGILRNSGFKEIPFDRTDKYSQWEFRVEN